jgi:Zn-dependent proteases
MRGLKIGAVVGIPVRLNWTFLLVLPLFAYLIGTEVETIAGVMNETMRAGIDPAAISGGAVPWLLGFAAVIGLFVGVLLHEFGHSLVAMRYGYQIESITLWLLGGLANFAEFPEDWKHEFWIAVAGPIVSLGVGAACYAVFWLTPAGSNAVLFVFGYLALLNVVLAVFNMLPAFPMDGGRVLRALLARSQPHAQATQRAATVGKVFAFLMGVFGVVTFQLLLIVARLLHLHRGLGRGPADDVEGGVRGRHRGGRDDAARGAPHGDRDHVGRRADEPDVRGTTHRLSGDGRQRPGWDGHP